MGFSIVVIGKFVKSTRFQHFSKIEMFETWEVLPIKAIIDKLQTKEGCHTPNFGMDSQTPIIVILTVTLFWPTCQEIDIFCKFHPKQAFELLAIPRMVGEWDQRVPQRDNLFLFVCSGGLRSGLQGPAGRSNGIGDGQDSRPSGVVRDAINKIIAKIPPV